MDLQLRGRVALVTGVGTPEDVGQLVAFLASELARYVNGATLRIDGGASGCV